MSDAIIPILMPKWGLSMKEGTLAVWHVAEGTKIKSGDEIMDVETDKIANVVEAADGGLLRRRVGEAGEVYPVRALLGVLAPESVSDGEVDAYIDAFELPEVEDEEESGPVYQFADLGVGRIRYSARPGEGTPIVLIHGFGGDLDNWLFNIDALSETAPVYALDLPGHGQSVKAVESPDLSVMVTTMVEFLDHLGVENAHLVGHSLGGLIAGQVAVEHPGRVVGLTLICSAGFGREINMDYIDGFVSSSGRRELKPVLKHLFADQSLVSRSMVDDLLKYKRLDGVGAFLRTFKESVFSEGKQVAQVADKVGCLGVPVDVIWGEADAIIPVSHAQAAVGPTVTVVPGAGHMVMMEAAAQVNDIIKAQF